MYAYLLSFFVISIEVLKSLDCVFSKLSKYFCPVNSNYLHYFSIVTLTSKVTSNYLHKAYNQHFVTQINLVPHFVLTIVYCEFLPIYILVPFHLTKELE
mgnify:CR=1 FL=1